MASASDNHRTDDGFTLVEVLVSMFIFSLISVGAFIALSTTLDAREAAQERIEQVERLAAMHQLMKDDFGSMIDRQNRDGLGGFINAQQREQLIDGFELTRRGRPNPDGAFPRGDLLRIGWRLENSQLIRSFLPHENPAYVEPPIDRVVLDGVEAMAVNPLVRDQSERASNVPFAVPMGTELILTHEDGTTTRHLFAFPDD